MDLASARQIRFVDLTPYAEAMKKINAGYNLGPIPANTYPQQTAPVPQIVYSAHLIASCEQDKSLLASEPVFKAFRLLGAAYLVWLGIQTLWAARSPGRRSVADRPEALRPAPSMLVGFRQGLLSDLSNPKIAAFFASIRPQFAPQDQGMLSSLVLLGLVFSIMTLAWLFLYAMVIA